MVAWLTLRPIPVPWVPPPNLHPFATVRADLAGGRPAQIAHLLRELAWLAPLGVLLPVAAGRLRRPLAGTWASTVAGSALVSCALVLLRSAVPGHRVNVDSVLLNTFGVALVALLVFPLLRAWARRGDGPSPRGGAPASHPGTRPHGGGHGTGRGNGRSSGGAGGNGTRKGSATGDRSGTRSPSGSGTGCIGGPRVRPVATSGSRPPGRDANTQGRPPRTPRVGIAP